MRCEEDRDEEEAAATLKVNLFPHADLPFPTADRGGGGGAADPEMEGG